MLQELTDPVSRLSFGGVFALDLDFFLVCAKALLSGHAAERSHSVVCGILSTIRR